ncbi:MAG: restriction endonuclease subunit S [Prevotella sp.]|nr:restriction endonuclease subunit S [Prevotella sp.]
MVEWKKLGDIAEITIGEFVHRDKQNPNAKYPVYNGGTTYTGFYDHYNNTGNKIVISARGYAGFVNRVFDNYWAGNSSYSIKIDNSQIIWHYVYYYLKNEQYNIMSMQQKGGGLASISKKQVQELSIPIPSLQEQERIVGILDTFTASIDNLKEQIEQRRKQYEHYRDSLLDLEGKSGVEMKMIVDICKKICSGGTPSTSHKEYYSGNIPWLRTQEIDWKDIYDTEIKITEDAIANSSAKMIPENCVIVAMYGATAAKVAINKIQLCTNQACCNLEIEESKALYKYVYFWLCREYLNLRSMGEGSQNNINSQKVKNYPIPLPPLSEQERIVSILDKFEASIANLEAQLEQRQKQYEYYRERLLTFDKLE